MRLLWILSDWLRHKALLRRDNPRHAWGARGEDLAHRFLQKLGYIVVARNWRAEDGSGELDLVAWDGPTLVVVEVKTRASADFGLPEEGGRPREAATPDPHCRPLRSGSGHIRSIGCVSISSVCCWRTNPLSITSETHLPVRYNSSVSTLTNAGASKRSHYRSMGNYRH